MTHDSIVKRYTRRHADRCVEAATYQGTNIRLDTAAGVLYDVKVLGWDSRNKRRYSKDAATKAQHLYEGVKVNLNHAITNDTDLTTPVRDVKDRFGRLKGVQVRDDGLYANLHYNPGHSWSKAFEWFAENDPSAIGLSHDAILQGPVGSDGIRVIESIPKVFSVDIVADPGSVKSLYEAEMDPQTAMPGGEGSLEDHLCDAIGAIIRDKELDPKARKQKINKLLKLLFDEADEKPSPADSMETEAMKEEPTGGTESLKAEIAELKAQLDTFRAKEQLANDTTEARKLCAKAGLPEKLVSDTFVQNMVLRGRESWEDLISDRKALLTVTPESAGHSGGTKPSLDEFVRQARGGK
jgi:hypothetical protein